MTRLQKSLTWTCDLTYDEGHVVNEYLITLDLLAASTDEYEQSIAYQRLKWWISSVLQGSVFINQHDPLLSAYSATRQKVLVFPSDPVDHLVAMTLYLKFNAIMEERLIVTEIKLSSDHGDHMCYLYSNNKDGVINDNQGWWVDPSPSWHWEQDSQESNVVDLCQRFSWKELDLGWQQQTNHESKVIFKDFSQK